jgi:plasmid stabilization system protein ParE
MEFEIVVTKTAETDFDEAISYIAVSLANPSAASALADEFEMALKQISDNPFLFHHFKDSDSYSFATSDSINIYRTNDMSLMPDRQVTPCIYCLRWSNTSRACNRI